MRLHLHRPGRRLLILALVAVGGLAVLPGVAPRLDLLFAGSHGAHQQSAVAPGPDAPFAGQPEDGGRIHHDGRSDHPVRSVRGDGDPRSLHVLHSTAHHGRQSPSQGPSQALAAVAESSATASPSADRPAPLLTIAALRRLQHEGTTGPVAAIAPPQQENGFTLQRVDYQSEGLQVTATLLIPDGHGRHPLVLALHGLANPRNYVPGGDIMAMALSLAQHGVFVCVPDYRGLGGSAPDPRTEPVPIGDAIDALNLLDIELKNPDVDPHEVGLLAHSLGGHVAEIVLAAHSGIKAAALYAPAESQAAALYQRRPYYYYGRGGVGTPAQDPSLYDQMSPGDNFGDLDGCDVLLQHGTNDPVVPPHASIILDQELKDAGANVTLVMVPGATHNLGEDAWAAGRQRGIDFLVSELGIGDSQT